MPPSLDGSRQGQYYINTYQPEERQLHKIAAITFHEATPGHHFQIAIEMELTGLPRVPDARRPDGRRGLRRGLGPLLRAAGRRDGPLPVRRPGAARHARRAGVPRRAPGRRLRAARHGLDPRPGDRVHARARYAADGRRRDRGRPLHDLAGPGAVLQDSVVHTAAESGRGSARRIGRRSRRSSRFPRRTASSYTPPVCGCWATRPVRPTSEVL